MGTNMFQRVFLLLLDGVGIGALPDAASFGDEGASTLRHVLETAAPELPNLAALGLHAAGNLPTDVEPMAAYGRMATLSKACDTLSGHLEICGLVTRTPHPTYPDGFPASLIDEFSRRTRRPVFGNRAASGTEIIEELGEKQMRTGGLIVYTSADSVFQVAAHEDVVSVEELYRACRTAREMLVPPHRVARVIARPFVGTPGAFQRTAKRKDLSLPPDEPTLLDLLADSGRAVIGVGKIHDIFSGHGVTESHHTCDNAEGIAMVLEKMDTDFEGLLFANLNDFDTRWGHRNDSEGFARALTELDRAIPALLKGAGHDLVVFTADHGCDPLHPGTDHTREYVPVLAWHRGQGAAFLGTRPTLADLGQTLARNFGLRLGTGNDFCDFLRM
jgi:phosphopentomutase